MKPYLLAISIVLSSCGGEEYLESTDPSEPVVVDAGLTPEPIQVDAGVEGTPTVPVNTAPINCSGLGTPGTDGPWQKLQWIDGGCV